MEYNVSYVYHALFAYFDRDNVGLPGIAEYVSSSAAYISYRSLSRSVGGILSMQCTMLMFSEHIALHRYFRDASDEKRERAETLMRYQVGKIVS